MTMKTTQLNHIWPGAEVISMTRTGESPREANAPMHLLTAKSKTRIGTWNVQTLYQSGKLHQVARELKNYGIQLLGLCETRWNGCGMIRLQTGETIVYSGHPNEDHEHTQGVAILMASAATQSLVAWEAISPRLISARFNSKGRKVTIIQCYAPTNVAEIEEKEQFYSELQAVLNRSPKSDIKIIMGDLNAKVGNDNSGRELVMGKHGVGLQNENGEMFADFCHLNDLVIGGTVFPHKNIHKCTWVSPDGKTENQIDHITIARKWRRSLLDVRVWRGADAASDHHLLTADLQLKLKAFHKIVDRPHTKYNVQFLRDPQKHIEFIQKLNEAVQSNDLSNAPVEDHWNAVRHALHDTCTKVLGRQSKQQKEWMSADTWNKVEHRRYLKQCLSQQRDPQKKEALKKLYVAANKQVKRGVRRDKRHLVADLTEEAEQAVRQNNLKRLYEITRALSGKAHNYQKPIRAKNGKVLTTHAEQSCRWVEHFQELLNRPPPHVLPDISSPTDELPIDTHAPTTCEVVKAVTSLKNGKAMGPDGTPVEALKADPQTTAKLLQPLLEKIWETEEIPPDWKSGYLIKLPKKGDLSECNNWRGIMLLSSCSKVLTRVILDRLRNALDTRLRPEQAGFRQNGSCTDHIATLRIIIEESVEWQSPLHMTFVDFEKAFDSVDRQVLWELMRHYGIPNKIISIIQKLYEDSTCRIIHQGRLSQPFWMRTGVKQGCMLSPIIFLMVIDWIMRRTTSEHNMGLNWPGAQLEDLDFADDICLLSHRGEDAQRKLHKLADEAEKTGLRVNTAKTEVMHINLEDDSPLCLNGVSLKVVDRFTYLGSIVNKDGGADEDVRNRLTKARTAFHTLRPIWKSTALSLQTKVRIFNTNVKAVLLYGSETWRVMATTTKKLQVFINRCLRFIAGVRWPTKLSNAELWSLTNQRPIEAEIRRRKWSWLGHTLRKPADNTTRQALDWKPHGKRKRGRPRNTWKRSVEKEAAAMQLRWSQLAEVAQDRTQWKKLVTALCSDRS